MNEIDFLITTFKRMECLSQLLLSIAKYYPEATIYIADQNENYDEEFYSKLWNGLKEAGLKTDPYVFKLPYDCGLSYARNYLVQNTPNKYKLVLDDDFIFTPFTKIEKFLKLLEVKGAGVVGGLVKTNKIPVHFEYRLLKNNNTLFYAPDGDKYQEYEKITYKETGCILNFSLYKKEVFEDVLWDEELKIAEHTDFMYRLANTKWKILYTPEVCVNHVQERSDEYKEMRLRYEFIKLSFKKLGVTKIHYVHNGQTTALINDKIIKYRKPNANFIREFGEAIRVELRDKTANQREFNRT